MTPYLLSKNFTEPKLVPAPKLVERFWVLQETINFFLLSQKVNEIKDKKDIGSTPYFMEEIQEKQVKSKECIKQKMYEAKYSFNYQN